MKGKRIDYTVVDNFLKSVEKPEYEDFIAKYPKFKISSKTFGMRRRKTVGLRRAYRSADQSSRVYQTVCTVTPGIFVSSTDAVSFVTSLCLKLGAKVQVIETRDCSNPSSATILEIRRYTK